MMLRKRSNFSTSTSFQNAVNSSLVAATSFMRASSVVGPESLPPASRVGHRVPQQGKSAEQPHAGVRVAAIGLRGLPDVARELRLLVGWRREEIEHALARIGARNRLVFLPEVGPRRLADRQHRFDLGV